MQSPPCIPCSVGVDHGSNQPCIMSWSMQDAVEADPFSGGYGANCFHAGHDSDEEGARGMPAVPRPISPVSVPAPVVTHASAPPQQAGQAQRANAMLRALHVVRAKGKQSS